MEHIGDAVPLTELLDERRHLVGVAHWMLGSRVTAERVADEAYREWYGLGDGERSRIQAPRTWLTHVVGGLSLARLAPLGPNGDTRGRSDCQGVCEDGPEREVSEVLLRVVDTLSPAQRAAFVLDGLYGAPASRAPRGAARSVPVRADPAVAARQGLRARSRRPAGRHEETVRAVRQACAHGNHEALAALLTDDVTAYFDGGGKVRAPVRPVTGDENVARSLITLLSACRRTTVDTWPVNGRTGLVARCDEQVAAVITLDLVHSRVAQVWAVLNPDKLRSWNRVAHESM
ncbi:RNA polymerase sigma factor [Streptomyces spiroverticillatus]|uniref:RNA polymerase sigma factor n=1 Tax=Streptomyces finlayi TaxID=67296 RepID=A0A918WX00_9ACTN|nr:RNA polymerase subunit sigma [Streptomyces finlayi]GHA09044.1 RNA polymerase sigma factor [Streptomyces spiroverticillatus]GHC91839.1 RNA polymerase sigma factor [Streptomyces finlayi]